MNEPLRQALDLVARRPRLPLPYMAILLKHDPVELELRLLAAANVGWVVEYPGCCQQQSQFEVTEAGLRACRDGELLGPRVQRAASHGGQVQPAGAVDELSVAAAADVRRDRVDRAGVPADRHVAVADAALDGLSG